MPVLLAHAIEDSTHIFGILGVVWTPPPPVRHWLEVANNTVMLNFIVLLNFRAMILCHLCLVIKYTSVNYLVRVHDTVAIEGIWLQ